MAVETTGVVILVVLAMLLVFFLSPNKYVVETVSLRRQIGNDGAFVDQLLPVLSYRPKETEHFEYLAENYLSDIYVPYETILEDPSARPFEIRWPGYYLPAWARKVESGSWKPVPKGKHICFVSVGKTAGSSMSGLLGFQLHGPDVYFIPSGLLSHFTTHIFHGSVNNCPDDTPYYLFTMRHPLQRLLSAFAYDRDKHPFKGSKEIYRKCGFKTLNILAKEGLAKDGRAPDHCKRLAYELVRGSGYMYSYHLFCNYNYYQNVTLHTAQHPQDRKILAIRTEHMEDDWNSAERVIGGEKHVDVNVPHLNQHTKDTKDAELSEKSQVLLCEALCDDIQIYKQILREAVNLNKRDFAQSMAELKTSCPLQVNSDVCSDR
jgi:hypothetical protein